MHNTAHRSFIQIYLLINLYFNSTAHEFMSSRIICLGNKQYFQQIKAKYTKSIGEIHNLKTKQNIEAVYKLK